MTDGAMLTEILAALEIPCDKCSFHGKLDALAAGLGISTEGRLLGDVLDDIAAKEGIQRDNRLYGAFIRKLYDYVTNGEDVTLAGNPLVLANSMGKPLKECVVSWEPTQEGTGTPSPDNIRPIHGRDSVQVERCGENLVLFPYSFSAASRNGLVITLQQDGGITVNGTATADTWYVFNANIEKRLPMNTPMALSGCPAGGSTKSYYIGLYLAGKWHADTGKGYTDINFTTREIASRIEVSIIKGTVCNNLTFYPKIEVGTTITPYSKYQGSTNILILPETVYGGTVDAVTGEGQETWKLLTLTGTEAWGKYGSANEQASASCFSLYIDDKQSMFGTSVCNQFMNTKNSDPFFNVKMRGFTYTDHPSLPAIYMNYGDDQTITVDTWKAYLAAQYAAGTPVQIAYKLATPIPFTVTGGGAIPTVKGTNTLLTDADTIKATYRCNVRAAEQEINALYTDLLNEVEE